jgi:hypothetical protein
VAQGLLCEMAWSRTHDVPVDTGDRCGIEIKIERPLSKCSCNSNFLNDRPLVPLYSPLFLQPPMGNTVCSFETSVTHDFLPESPQFPQKK